MQIAFGLYPGLTLLDFVGPYQVLSQMPGTDVVVCAAAAGPLADDNGLVTIQVQHTFADTPRPDVLVVPGGMATRREAREGNAIVEWVRSAHEHTTWTTSVCTGSLVLGAAGVLDGLPATTHWNAYDHLRRFGAEPTPQRVVTAGKVITAAGVSSGIDMALTLVAALGGDDMARAIQLGIEYDPQPPFDAGSPATAPAEVLEIVKAVMDASEARALSEG
jgi:transcriptional regulator GlxA family with amidase domain